MVLVSHDTAARATYVKVSSEPVSRTVHVSDLVAVDIDVKEQPVGVEFIMRPALITDDVIDRVVARFPGLEVLKKTADVWLPSV